MAGKTNDSWKASALSKISEGMELWGYGGS